MKNYIIRDEAGNEVIKLRSIKMAMAHVENKGGKISVVLGRKREH